MAQASDIPRSPITLGRRGKALWTQVQKAFVLDATEEVVLVELCRAVDRSDRIAAELEGQPLAVAGSAGQIRVNPLVGALDEVQKLVDRLAGSLAVVSAPGASGERGRRAHQRKAALTRWAGKPGPIALAGGA